MTLLGHNYFLDAFRSFEKSVFAQQNRLSIEQSIHDNAIRHAMKNFSDPVGLNYELFGSISFVRDITADQDATFVRPAHDYNVNVKQYESVLNENSSFQALTAIHKSWELLDAFLKNSLAAILLIDDGLRVAEQTSPSVVTWEYFQSIVRKRNISFKKITGYDERKDYHHFNIHGIVDFLCRRYPELNRQINDANCWNLNYVSFLEMCEIIRHAEVHAQGIIKNVSKVNLKLLSGFMNYREEGKYILLQPSISQASLICERIKEFSFMLTKQLSLLYRLPILDEIEHFSQEQQRQEYEFLLSRLKEE
ncbi:MAG TPA: hypothetical protein VM802_06960 [Chitinophaga sp.]|uniref:hypothetical protein n=1 Tax=Chitinophaga sp. TaxID=1869181 RepID=UPI002C8A2968|nr:hypothetical protein [Chitinophaga sp.]HVI44590.1 hypothetical protein [Chitinophaga sp.]